MLLSLHDEFVTQQALKQCTINNLLKLFLIQVQRLLPEVVNETAQTTLFGALNTLLEENNYKINTPIYYAKKLKVSIITPPINNLNYVIILDGKNRRKKIITKRVV